MLTSLGTSDAIELPELPEQPALRPSTVAELLERTVAAVSDDARGRRVRLALLTTAQTAAAEAGQPLPPAVHEIRQRVLRGAVPWIGAGGVFVDEPAADVECLAVVVRAIHAAQRLDESGAYDGLFAPTHDDALDAMLRRAAVAVRPASLGETSECVVTAPLFGRHLVICSADACPDQRRVALRRALAHVLCGHVGEAAPLPSPTPTAIARTADLFALADLAPFWQLAEWRRGNRMGWSTLAREVARLAASLAGDWDAMRASEVARLRVLLYRRHGL